MTLDREGFYDTVLGRFSLPYTWQVFVSLYGVGFVDAIPSYNAAFRMVFETFSL